MDAAKVWANCSLSRLSGHARINENSMKLERFAQQPTAHLFKLSADKRVLLQKALFQNAYQQRHNDFMFWVKFNILCLFFSHIAFVGLHVHWQVGTEYKLVRKLATKIKFNRFLQGLHNVQGLTGHTPV